VEVRDGKENKDGNVAEEDGELLRRRMNKNKMYHQEVAFAVAFRTFVVFA
jgi:hypothetical protein